MFVIRNSMYSGAEYSPVIYSELFLLYIPNLKMPHISFFNRIIWFHNIHV